MGMAECAKTGENARWRGRTARAHPIFDICDFILRSNSLKFQILSPLIPLNLWLDFEKMMHCPFKRLCRGDSDSEIHIFCLRFGSKSGI